MISIAFEKRIHKQIGTTQKYEGGKYKYEGEIYNKNHLIPVLVADTRNSLFDSILYLFGNLNFMSIF